MPEAAVTGDDTNTLILQLRNKGLLGVGTTGLTATKSYTLAVDLVAFKPDALVLSTTVADRDIADGEVQVVISNETEGDFVAADAVRWTPATGDQAAIR